MVTEKFNCNSIRLWRALTNPAQMKLWYFDLAHFEATPGFQFQFYGEGHTGVQYLHHCEVKTSKAPELLSYSWRYEGIPGESTVSFNITEVENGCRLDLVHTGLDTFPQDNPDMATSSFQDGWNYLIATALKGYVEDHP